MINIKKIKENYQNEILGKKIVLKFKASSEIGIGHLSRMITLASFLQEDNREVICAVNDDEYIKKRLEKESLEFIASDVSDEEFIDLIIKEINPDTLVIDEKKNYSIKKLVKWKSYAHLIAIDHISTTYKEFQKIIIPNAHFNMSRYNFQSNIYYGWEWVLISKEVLKLKPKQNLPQKIDSIVVTTGGSDPYGILFIILELIKNIKKNVFILIGDKFKYKDRLYSLKLPKNFKFQKFKPCHLLKGDIAITTFGVSVYEFIYLNIPVYCISHNLYDEKNADVLEEKCHLVKNLGYFKKINKFNNINLLESLDNYAIN